MKILFHNYTNYLSTEPLYLHNAFLQCGVESVFWANKQVSAYDIFDVNKPNVFVTHFQFFTHDIATYLKNNKNCDLVMNVTGATQSQVDSVEKFLAENNIKTPFLFTNDFFSTVKSSLNLISLYPATDLFAAKSNFENKIAPEAVITNNFNENLKNCIAEKEVFHLLYLTDNDLDSNFDFRTNALSLHQLYKLYSKITLVGDSKVCCSQLFFDLSFNCKDVEIKSSDTDKFYKMLESIFTESENLDTKLEIKNQIKSKHTPFHRAWRFMKYLGDSGSMSKIDKVKDQLPEALKDI